MASKRGNIDSSSVIYRGETDWDETVGFQFSRVKGPGDRLVRRFTGPTSTSARWLQSVTLGSRDRQFTYMEVKAVEVADDGTGYSTGIVTYAGLDSSKYDQFHAKPFKSLRLESVQLKTSVEGELVEAQYYTQTSGWDYSTDNSPGQKGAYSPSYSPVLFNYRPANYTGTITTTTETILTQFDTRFDGTLWHVYEEWKTIITQA